MTKRTGDQPSGSDLPRKPQTMEEKIEAYFEGYRRIPDGDDPDFVAFEKLWLEDSPCADEDWPEAPEDGSRAS
jgi:hypothetical protein